MIDCSGKARQRKQLQKWELAPWRNIHLYATTFRWYVAILFYRTVTYMYCTFPHVLENIIQILLFAVTLQYTCKRIKPKISFSTCHYLSRSFYKFNFFRLISSLSKMVACDLYVRECNNFGPELGLDLSLTKSEDEAWDKSISLLYCGKDQRSWLFFGAAWHTVCPEIHCYASQQN